MKSAFLRSFRSLRWWRLIGTSFFSAIGVGAVAVSVSAAFWPAGTAHAWVTLGLVTIGVAAVYALANAIPKTVEKRFDRPNTSIRLVEGDLLAQPFGIAVGMTTTFDTAIPEIISADSVQGQLLSRVFGSDLDLMSASMDAALALKRPLRRIDKPGKTTVYPLGTVAVVERLGHKYYCVAYSEMNDRNEAHATVDGLWHSLSSLWSEVRAASGGDPVAVPVIGGGQARVSQVLPAADSIRFIALSFVLASRQKKVCDRLDIVVTEELAGRLDMLDIQAYLDSLGDS